MLDEEDLHHRAPTATAVAEQRRREYGSMTKASARGWNSEFRVTLRTRYAVQRDTRAKGRPDEAVRCAAERRSRSWRRRSPGPAAASIRAQAYGEVEPLCKLPPQKLLSLFAACG